MTVGIFISPSGVPAIITDTMAFRDGEDNHSGLPTRYSPHTDVRKPIRSLYRKSFIIDDNVALSVAGEVGQIADFVQNFRLLQHSFGIEDAFTKIESLATDYPTVQALICDANSNGTGVDFRLWPFRVYGRCSASHPLVGDIRTIGSGADNALKLTLDYAKQAESFDKLSKRPQEIVQSLSHYVASTRIRREQFNLEELTWGGFLEFVYFDNTAKRWSRNPRCLYIFFEVVLLGNQTYTTLLIARSYAYEPGGTHGEIMVKESSVEGSAGFVSYIQDIFSDSPISPGGPDLWYDQWKPEIANISFVVFNRDHGFKTCNVTTVDSEIDGVVYHIDRDTTTYGLRDDLCDYYSEKAYRYTGWKYVPARELSDSEINSRRQG